MTDERPTDQETDARDIVAMVADIARLIAKERGRCAETGHDATRFAGFMAREILARKGSFRNANVNRLRFSVNESPRPKDDARAFAATAALVGCILDAFRSGGAPDAVLERVAELWPKYDTKAEADRAVLAVSKDEADATAREVEAAHMARLAKSASLLGHSPSGNPGYTRSSGPVQPNDGEFIPPGAEDFPPTVG